MQPSPIQTRFAPAPKRSEAPIRSASTLQSCVPIDILEALLRDHLADQAATITAYASTALVHQGTNDSNSFFRVSFSWSLPNAALSSHTSTWIIKHWKAGGARDTALG